MGRLSSYLTLFAMGLLKVRFRINEVPFDRAFPPYISSAGSAAKSLLIGSAKTASEGPPLVMEREFDRPKKYQAARMINLIVRMPTNFHRGGNFVILNC